MKKAVDDAAKDKDISFTYDPPCWLTVSRTYIFSWIKLKAGEYDVCVMSVQLVAGVIAHCPNAVLAENQRDALRECAVERTVEDDLKRYFNEMATPTEAAQRKAKREVEIRRDAGKDNAEEPIDKADEKVSPNGRR